MFLRWSESLATVIKAGQTGKLLRFVKPLMLKDHVAEAHAVLREARTRAVQIGEQAKVSAAEAEAAARREGFEKGFAEGRIEGREVGRTEAFEQAKELFRTEQEGLVSALKRVVSSFETTKRELTEKAERDVLALAVEVAEQITKRAGAADSLAAVGNAAEAIRLVGSATDLVVRVNPRDVEAMGKYAGELKEELHRQRHVTLVEDGSIEPGGCIVETSKTRVDATLGEQFKQAAALLLGGTGVSDSVPPDGDDER